MNLNSTACLIVIAALSGLAIGPAASAGVLPGVDAALHEANVDLDAAKQKLVTGNLQLSSRAAGEPAASITADDELVISDKTVPLDATQKARLHDYREQVIALGLHGIEIGRRATAIAGGAVGPAILQALLGADDDSIERDVRRRLAPIRQSVLNLCGQLPTLIARQQQLEAAVPEFRPYANAEPDDVEACRKDALESFDDGPATAAAN